MSQRQIEQKYRKLLAIYGNQPVSVTLQELADALFCTRRYMRSLLLQMQEAGWINWQARPGRGHRAGLHLLRSEGELLREKAEQLLDAGHFNDAIRLLGADQQLVAQLLRSRLGHSVRADYQRLRIPYYRSMPTLRPGQPLRRSEQHLVQQIFSGLTRINDRTGEVQTDLAHSWQQQDALHWRFYLRPAVLWHDGRELTSEDVAASLTRSARLPLFSHLRKVRAISPRSIEITLSQQDNQLPLLLSHIDALIQPQDVQLPASPVGTGPYRVVENNDWHLQMLAFDRYFGLRGLLDEIEIVTLPALTRSTDERATTLLSSGLSDADYTAGKVRDASGAFVDPLRGIVLERGGYFLLCDSRSPHWHHAEPRRWLRQILNPQAIAQRLNAAIRPLWTPAQSMLAGWSHSWDAGAISAPFTRNGETQVLRLAWYRQHPELPMLLAIMQTLLAEHGVRLEGIELDYTAWAAGESEADLWLGTVNFALPEAWHVGAWLLGSPLLRKAVHDANSQRLAQWQTDWRAQRVDAEQLLDTFIGTGWLQPLFHHWMRLKGPDSAQGIALNNLGWFDFSSSWLVPDTRPKP